MAEPTEAASLLNAWLASSLRVTLFTLPGSRPAAQGWWSSVTGEESEQTTSTKTGGYKEVGKFNDHSLSLEVLGTRINWELISIVNPELPGAEFPILGPFVSKRDVFLHAMERWIPSAPPCLRLAFGANLFLPQETKEESFRTLSSLLPFRVDAQREGDLFYAINRYATSQSAVPNLRLNRYRKWSAVKFQLRTGLPGKLTDLVGEQHGCFLELDMNTDADRTEELIPKEQLGSLLWELAALGTAITERGDLG